MKLIREIWALDATIEKIAEQVQTLEIKRNAFANILRSTRLELDLCAEIPLAQRYLIDGQLARQVKPTKLSGLSVCGVDGGLLKKSLRGIELVITRANATIFQYSSSGRVSAEYFPERKTPPIVKAELDPISWREAEINASLERLKAELQLAIRIQDHFTFELLLLDGSLIPHISDRPVAQSNLSTKYQEIRSLFTELYQKTEETGTLLAGVVKDSRSNRFIRVLGDLLPHLVRRQPRLAPILEMDYRTLLKNSYDTDFFFRVLDVGERSCIFRLEDLIIDNNSELVEEEKMKTENIVCFYLRTAKYDHPLRIEVFTGSYDQVSIAKKVSSMLLPMSSDNEEFALPAVLIDADSQARLIERDLDFFFNQLIQRIGFPQSLLKLRRDRMPFH
ncbi:MAG: DNA double-strand break repair nuclease NurA [Promethearchaeota archaeon]